MVGVGDIIKKGQEDWKVLEVKDVFNVIYKKKDKQLKIKSVKDGSVTHVFESTLEG